MQSEDILLKGWLNPLVFDIIDEPWGPRQSQLDLENILEVLCTPGLEHDVNSFIKRGKEISKGSFPLSIVPNEEKFLARLVWPLRHAKAGYMLGNYIGTIALCGFVAEMLAILLYDIANVSLQGKSISPKEEKMLLGSNFEKLGQARRTEVLRVIDQIDDEVKELFDTVRNMRNKYLHLYNQPHENLAEDTLIIFHKAVTLVVKAIGLDINSGRCMMRPDLIKHMKDLGIFTDKSDAEKNQS